MAVAQVTGQKAEFIQNSTGSVAVAMPGNVTSGNVIVARGSSDDGSGSGTIAKTAGTATIDAFTQYGNTTRGAWMAVARVTGSGSLTITVDPPGSGDDYSGIIQEYQGVDATTAVDADGGRESGSSTDPSNTITTASAIALVVGVASHDGSGTTIAVDAPAVEIDEDETAAAGGEPYSAADLATTTAGGYTVNWTLGAIRSWTTYSIALKEAAAAGGPANPLRGERLVNRGVLRGVHRGTL